MNVNKLPHSVGTMWAFIGLAWKIKLIIIIQPTADYDDEAAKASKTPRKLPPGTDPPWEARTFTTGADFGKASIDTTALPSSTEAPSESNGDPAGSCTELTDTSSNNNMTPPPLQAEPH